MNWGHKLLIVIILFLAMILGMVYYASQQQNEMVDDHYYEKEMEYQKVIDAKRNLAAVTDQKLVNQLGDQVLITFPVGLFEKFESGHVELLRNNDKSKDLKKEVVYNPAYVMLIPKTELEKGWYTVRISWRNDGTDYYREEKLWVE